MDITLNIYIFFGIQFFTSGLSIIILIFYPYIETKVILIIFLIFSFLYISFFIYSLFVFKKETIENFMNKINFKPLLYILSVMQIFLLILMVGGDKFTENQTVQLCTILYFFINIFYIVIINISFSTLRRIEIESDFEDVVKGKEVKPNDDFECSICLTSELKTVIKLRCEHFFHWDCLKESFQNDHKKCALCRESFV
jgi:hypothetical protein